MKKVFQKVLNDPGHGDCMQAVFASLFDMELEEVPPFIEFGDEYFDKILEFIDSKGYQYEGCCVNGDDNAFDIIHNEEGVNGYFYAVVNSPKFYTIGGTHAIVVDRELNIVHDPCPDYQDFKYPYAEELGYNGIVMVLLINKKNDYTRNSRLD